MAAINLANPGAKEYLIVGGIALVGGYLIIRRGQAKQAAAPAPAVAQQQPATAGQPQTVIAQGNGVPWQALKAFLLDQQSSPSPAPAARNATVTEVAGGGPGQGAAWVFTSPGQPGKLGTSAHSGSVPLGSSVTITGPAVQGAPAGITGNLSNTYYPFSYQGQTGYLSSLNVSGYGG